MSALSAGLRSLTEALTEQSRSEAFSGSPGTSVPTTPAVPSDGPTDASQGTLAADAASAGAEACEAALDDLAARYTALAARLTTLEQTLQGDGR